MENANEMRYPRQIGAIKRKDKTLGVDGYLFTPDENDKSCSPLELHNGFSRFLFTIVDKSNSTVATPRANLPAGDVATVYHKSMIALQHYFLGGSVGVAPENDDDGGLTNGLAFTQKITMGKYKGKTPAEILIENPAEKAELISQRDWLQRNADKYPANKLQIQAIEEAIQLLEIGELNPGASTSPAPSTSFVKEIYKTEFKHMSQKNEKGDTLVYSISITFDAAKKYPFTVEIANCFAPIEVLPSGQHRPMMTKATHMTKSSMAMSDVEWIGLIDHIVSVKKYFEVSNFERLYAIAMEKSYQHK